MAQRANIKVSRETFDALSEDKGDASWEYYLRENCLDSGASDIDDVLRAIEEIPERTADRVIDSLR